MRFRLPHGQRGSAEVIGLMGGLLVAGSALLGGAQVARTSAVQAHLKRVAEAVAENVSENGCYDARTDAQVRSYLDQAGLDPSRLALSATTNRQPYGEGVQARVEYLLPITLLGLETPLRVRVAATATAVSNHVAPVRNNACTQPTFAGATGSAGIESGDARTPAPQHGPAPGAGAQPNQHAFQPWRDSEGTPARSDAPKCGPVTKTRRVTKYRDEAYQVQVGSREETRYREETYQVPVQRTRTVTRYRKETYQVQVGTRQETKYREVTKRKKVCSGTLYKRCTYRTYRDLEPYTVSVPIYETRTRQVPYEVTETYTEHETRTRQVPYTVTVPVYETRTRRIPYAETETYVENVPCPGGGTA